MQNMEMRRFRCVSDLPVSCTLLNGLCNLLLYRKTGCGGQCEFTLDVASLRERKVSRVFTAVSLMYSITDAASTVEYKKTLCVSSCPPRAAGLGQTIVGWELLDSLSCRLIVITAQATNQGWPCTSKLWHCGLGKVSWLMKGIYFNVTLHTWSITYLIWKTWTTCFGWN